MYLHWQSFSFFRACHLHFCYLQHLSTTTHQTFATALSNFPNTMPKVVKNDSWVEMVGRNFIEDTNYGLRYHMRGCKFMLDESLGRTLKMQVRQRCDDLKSISSCSSPPDEAVSPLGPLQLASMASSTVWKNDAIKFADISLLPQNYL